MTTSFSPLSDFGFGLTLAARRWRRAIDDALARYGLSDASWRPLLHLDRLGEGARQNDLAQSLGIEGPSLVRLLDRLARAGLVERREDASDRRAKTLHFTAQGREQTARLKRVVAEVCAEMLKGAPPQEIAAAMRLFERLAADADEPGGRP